MNREWIEQRLIAYMDGRLNEKERARMEALLTSSPEWRARLEEFRSVSSLLDEDAPVAPSLGFDARVRQRIAAEPRPRWFQQWLPSPRPALAFAMLLLVSVWLGSFQPAQSPQSVQNVSPEEEIRMIQNLPVLEDYDVLANFEVLSELQPAPSDGTERQM